MIYFIGINHDFIQINNYKNIKIFVQNLINIDLETSLSIKNAIRYYLELKLTISGLEGRFPLIFFANPYQVINTHQIKFCKIFGSTKLI